MPLAGGGFCGARCDQAPCNRDPDQGRSAQGPGGGDRRGLRADRSSRPGRPSSPADHREGVASTLKAQPALETLKVLRHANIRKRLLVHACGCKPGLLTRSLAGVGTPRTLQGEGDPPAVNSIAPRPFGVPGNLERSSGCDQGPVGPPARNPPGNGRGTRVGPSKDHPVRPPTGVVGKGT